MTDTGREASVDGPHHRDCQCGYEMCGGPVEPGREATIEVPRTLLEDIARRLYTAGDDLYREQVEKLLDTWPRS